MLYCMDDVCRTIYMSVITQDGESALMTATYYGKTEVVVELVKAGALLDLQNTVCPYPIIHDVQEHAFVYTETQSHNTCACHNTCHRVHDILSPSVFHFHSLHRVETQL